MKSFLTFVCAALLVNATLAAAPDRTFDVVVFGATPGGVAAAVAAAREKEVSVALVEPLDIVGGVMTSGLSFSDSNQTDRRVLLGLFEEIHLRIEKKYQERGVKLPYEVKTKDHSPWTYEPHVAEQVFHEMLQEAGVKIFLSEELEGVEKQGSKIVRITTNQGAFRAKSFVDATYEGDLMAKAGVPFTIGREGRAKYGESLAGRQFPKSVVTNVNPFDDDGNLLPLMTAKDAGDVEAGDDHVMTYSFRLCLTKDPANRVPIQKPANYDPARYELVRRYVTAHPPKRLLFDLYPLPGDKLDGNNSIGGQVSIGLVGGCNEWCEASYEQRRQIQQDHRDYTEGLFWFMASDPSMPENLRAEMQQMGYCKDELAKWGHFPPVLYVREGRRMLGRYVLTQRDVLEQLPHEDSIGVSSFPIDSHDVQRVPSEDGKGYVNEGTIFPVRIPGRRVGYAYQVPYRAITPEQRDCDNLLVPVALSASHVALSSVRVEPTWIMLGQSAGIAAAMSAKQEVAVQALPYDQLKEHLQAAGQALDLLPLPPLPKPAPVANAIPLSKLEGIVLDDSHAEKIGGWSHSTNFRPFVEQGYLHDGNEGKGSRRLVFRPEIPKAGKYDLRIAYSPHPTRAAKVPVLIESGGKRQVVTADETQPLDDGSAFRSFGTVNLAAGKETTITISNEGTDGFVICDAVQLIPVK
ncbi:FAD-dependent oxidoreductase [Blastopirellula sp. JC732]|uniref:FAD-dependent oxidoreductase n=1 Tax=Blastopirellula sediminis TaxID=2894196 RepID=A0A9X1SEK0_9BACT|nr:FAD-dependent oxidoreductase [Blastopirellula sediminis]MCC9607924.1 FAD-dependent oxidoreductase [Blastopirellula sediminis]MCC9627283.1 FAD-dependent oxidoreductase [Blastopirellula sediminis]